MSAYKLATDVVFRPVNSEAILLNISTGEYYGLSTVATLMLTHLLDHGDLESTVARVCGEYDVAPARARADLDRLIEELAGEGLLDLSVE